MRWIAALLRRLAAWCDPGVSDAVRDHAALLIHRADQSPLGTSGDYKRYLVYAALQKAFPGEPKRRLSLVIETTLAR